MRGFFLSRFPAQKLRPGMSPLHDQKDSWDERYICLHENHKHQLIFMQVNILVPWMVWVIFVACSETIVGVVNI